MEFTIEQYLKSGGCYKMEHINKLIFIDNGKFTLQQFMESKQIPLIDKYHFIMANVLNENQLEIFHTYLIAFCNEINPKIEKYNLIGNMINVFVEISKLKKGKIKYMNQLSEYLINFVNENSAINNA